jgi:hypothetical protein
VRPPCGVRIVTDASLVTRLLSQAVGLLQRINRAIARLSRSPGPIPGGGPMAARLDIEQVEAVEHEELEADDQRDQESE